MHTILTSNLEDCFLSIHTFQRHSKFEFSAVLLAFDWHCSWTPNGYFKASGSLLASGPVFWVHYTSFAMTFFIHRGAGKLALALLIHPIKITRPADDEHHGNPQPQK